MATNHITCNFDRIYQDPNGTHQEFLKFYIGQTSGDIAEFGTGHFSTGTILECIQGTGRKLISFENNKEWYERMRQVHPESPHHRYIFVEDWQKALDDFADTRFSLVFIDQGPWEARTLTLETFSKKADYLIIHDADYYAGNKIFGQRLPNGVYDFSDVAESHAFYYPAAPYPAQSGPPTLVISNTGCTVFKLGSVVQHLSGSNVDHTTFA